MRCPRLFRRTILAYLAALAIALVVFVVFPVDGASLRPTDADRLPRSFATWSIGKLYAADPPRNLFPSLHVSFALLAAGSAWKARRSYGIAAAAGVIPIAVSIFTVKQHYVADGVAALIVASVVGASLLLPYRPDGGHLTAFGRRGPIAFFVMLGLVYAALYAGYVLGA